MHTLLKLTFVASLLISPLSAKNHSAYKYLELSQKAALQGDFHNSDIYEKLALMKAESENNPDFDWKAFKKLKAQLKDRKKKKFSPDAAQFFKARCTSDETRICYVVDYSLSLKGKKEKLLRNELTRSINHLPKDAEFGIYFFAGPVWQPGDKVTPVKNKLHYKVNHLSNIINWRGKGAHTWNSSAPTITATWRSAHPKNKKNLIAKVQTQKLVYGTDWSHPLIAAMQMEPHPNVIYFMTDGACSTANKSAIEIAALAKQKGVRINSIAMMQPKAEKPMRYLSAQTGGDFVVINKKGQCLVEKAGTVVCPKLKHGDHEKPKKKKSKKKRK